MFCTECGAENKDTATFCRKCGVRLDEEDETRLVPREEDEEATRLRKRADAPREIAEPQFAYMPPSAAGVFVPDEAGVRQQAPVVSIADRPVDDETEREIFSISPTLIFVKAGYVLAAVGAVLLVALVSWLAGSLVPTTIAVLFGLALFLIPAYYHIRLRTLRYRLTETKLEVDAGLVARQTRNVPLRRVQDVTVGTSIAQRLMGIGDIVIDNASEEGGKLVMKNIDSPRKYADLLLKQMSRLER